MQHTDALSLSRVLVYGGPDSRQAVAERMLETEDAEGWKMLAATVLSHEPWLLRVRCLEVLGLAAGSAERATAEIILDLLCGSGDTPTDN